MARIARRSLRVRDLPLFSLDRPWHTVCDSDGRLSLRFFEPRYVELARRVLPPRGQGRFGYLQGHTAIAGGAGTLAQIEQFSWTGPGNEEGSGPVVVVAREAHRFRILAARSEAVAASKPPLSLAHVQLLTDRDLLRGSARDAWNYWMQELPASDIAEDLQVKRGGIVTDADVAEETSPMMQRRAVACKLEPASW